MAHRRPHTHMFVRLDTSLGCRPTNAIVTACQNNQPSPTKFQNPGIVTTLLSVPSHPH